MIRPGLKLYSTNVDLIPDARKLREQGVYDFVELYIMPDSYKSTVENWKNFNIPFIIHASHSFQGTNLAQAESWEINLKNFNEARIFADRLGSAMIILHGGNNGSIDETIRQLRLLDDSRIAIENKPKIGINNETCVGWSPSEFHQMADAGVLHGTALDFVHACCAAKSSGADAMELVREFMAFNPKVFHLSDGDALSEKDVHINMGKGNLDIAGFLCVFPEGALVTIETPRDPSKGLGDFVKDVIFLRDILAENAGFILSD